MALKSLNRIVKLDLFWGVADLKIDVSIYARKQNRQKMEGISASQF